MKLNQVNNNNQKPLRLNRSELAVPASRLDIFDKAAASNADVIFLDLEDSVTIEEKDQARKNTIEAIHEINWKNKTLSVRLNAVDSSFFKKDFSALFNKFNKNLDLIMLPKVNSRRDVIKLENAVKRIEKKNNIKKKVGFELIIETAEGLMNINSIANASKRIESLHFGAADFAASIGAKTLSIGEPNPNYGTLMPKRSNNSKREFYLNDLWQVALFNIKLAASINNLRAIDCPYGNFKDKKGFEMLAKSSYSLGFDGKMVIHPNQIEISNKIFSPSEKQIKEAKELLEVIEQSSKKGKGAVGFKGKLLDFVTIKQARNIVELYKKIKKNEQK